MHFSSRQDIDAPIAFVFTRMTDFKSFERQALRRGADVRRVDKLASPGVGMGWLANFSFRGKEREVRVEIVEFDQPNGYKAKATSSGIDSDVVVDLVPLSRGRTRLSVSIDLAGKSLGARLMLQSLKLAKGNLNSRFQKRVRTMALDIMERHRAQSD